MHPRYAKFNEKWGGYYTQEELRDIVAYAAQRNIEVIPEIDMPGHSKALGAICPEILCNYKPNTSTTNGLDIRNVWCAAKESNYAIIEDIIREVSAIFTSPYIHIGGDEVGKSQWAKCPDCQALKNREGLKNDAQIEVFCSQGSHSFSEEEEQWFFYKPKDSSYPNMAVYPSGAEKWISESE